jgi:hypothetical protein
VKRIGLCEETADAAVSIDSRGASQPTPRRTLTTGGIAGEVSL